MTFTSRFAHLRKAGEHAPQGAKLPHDEHLTLFGRIAGALHEARRLRMLRPPYN